MTVVVILGVLELKRAKLQRVKFSFFGLEARDLGEEGGVEGGPVGGGDEHLRRAGGGGGALWGWTGGSVQQEGAAVGVEFGEDVVEEQDGRVTGFAAHEGDFSELEGE